MYLKIVLYLEFKQIDIKRFNLFQYYIFELVGELGWFYQLEGFLVWLVYRVGGVVGLLNRGEDFLKIFLQFQYLIKCRFCLKSYNKMIDNISLIIYESQYRIYFFYYYMFLLIIYYLTVNFGFLGVMFFLYNVIGQFFSQRFFFYLNLGVIICLGVSDFINLFVLIFFGIFLFFGFCNRIGTVVGFRIKQFKRDISC